MKKVLLAYSGAFVLAVAACAQNGPGSTPGAGGNSTSGSAGTTGSAGSNNPAGVAGTMGNGGNPAGDAGTTGTGGSNNPAGDAGTTGTAGSTATGTAGNTGTAGSTATGTAGASGGRGGTTGSGGQTGTAGTGGSSTGRGGTTGTAGTTGSGGSSGTTGTAGTGGGIGTSLITGFDGLYWEVTPSGNTALSGTNYPFGPPAGGCPDTASWDTDGYINTRSPMQIGGTSGQKYTVNINVRGVVGTRCYTGGTPGSTAAGSPSGRNNTWYAGGKQFNDSIWNTMEIRVAPKVAGEANQPNSSYDVYYVNSFQNTSDWCQKEATYETRFDAKFPVMGGGTVTLVVHDTNCRTLANCGAVEKQTSCDTSAARIIDMAGTSPAPMNFTQPRTGQLGGSTYYLQWVWIDVTSVTSP